MNRELSDIEHMLNKQLEWMATRAYSSHTIDQQKYGMRSFIDWCEERTITRPQEVTPSLLERYQKYLYRYRKKDGRPLSLGTQHNRLVLVRIFFRWLYRNHYILSNPASELELPKMESRLPEHVLTLKEVEKILLQVDLNKTMGLRDRAILETFFSTGMRRSELLHLKLYDLDVERGTVFIRKGKGKKDRMVPIGDRAVSWIEKYVQELRHKLAKDPDNGTLFLNSLGTPLESANLGKVIRDYIKASGIGKKGSCHLFRHSMATLMLEGGADIRYIQEMLGHAKLETTQIYTKISIKKLKEVHNKSHPAAHFKKNKKKSS